MPTSSPRQKRLMQAVAHSPKFARKVGIEQSVGREMLGYAEGGGVDWLLDEPKPMQTGGRVNYQSKGRVTKSKIRFKEGLLDEASPTERAAIERVQQHALTTGNEALAFGRPGGLPGLFEPTPNEYRFEPGGQGFVQFPFDYEKFVTSDPSQPMFTAHPHPTSLPTPSQEDVRAWANEIAGTKVPSPHTMWVAGGRGPQDQGLVLRVDPAWDAPEIAKWFKRERQQRLKPLDEYYSAVKTMNEVLGGHMPRDAQGLPTREAIYNIGSGYWMDELAKRAPVSIDPRLPIVRGSQFTIGDVWPEVTEEFIRRGIKPYQSGGRVNYQSKGRVQKPIKAYHGSKYDFDKFDSSKIGTGEGAQVYGHGMYFAENPAVAKWYREQLAGMTPQWHTKSGQQRPWPEMRFDVLNDLYGIGRADYDAATSRMVLSNDPQKLFSDYEDPIQKLSDIGNVIRGIAASHPRPGGGHGDIYDYIMSNYERRQPGRMYDVSIHEDPQRFLSLDKPMGEQGLVGRRALDYLSEPFMEGAFNAGHRMPKGFLSPDFSQYMASEKLPGLRYLDRTSRDKDIGSSNYVVFPGMDDIVEITKKYQTGGRVNYQSKGRVYQKPSKLTIPGHGDVFADPLPPAMDAAGAYMRFIGRPNEHLIDAYPEFNEARAKRIAQAYDEMPHTPNDSRVKRAYDALIDETMGQYRALKNSGYEFEFIKPGEADPYGPSPALGYIDLRDRGHMFVFPTESGFGTLNDISDNPLLKRVGRVGDLDQATANDAFRIVHDMFGHHGPGNPFFRHKGEERAWLNHRGMYSPEALPAMTSETRGQNSWLNFGPYGERNRNASGADTIYADQKIGRLPEFAWDEFQRGGVVQGYQSRGRVTSKPVKRHVEFQAFDDLFGGELSKAGEMVRKHTEKTGKEGGSFGNEFFHVPLIRGGQNWVDFDGGPYSFGQFVGQSEQQNMPFFSVHSHPLMSVLGKPLGPRQAARIMQQPHPQLGGPLWPSNADLSQSGKSLGLHSMAIESAGLPNNRLLVARPEDRIAPADLSAARRLTGGLEWGEGLGTDFWRAWKDYNEGAGLHPSDMLPIDLLINEGVANRGVPMYVDPRTSTGGLGRSVPASDLLPDFRQYLERRKAMPFAEGGVI